MSIYTPIRSLFPCARPLDSDQDAAEDGGYRYGQSLPINALSYPIQPNQYIYIVTTRQTEEAGQTIPAGDGVNVFVGDWYAYVHMSSRC